MNMEVLMFALSIELVWVEIPPFLGIFEVWYRYQTVWYRYHMCSGRLVPVLRSRYRYPMFCFRPTLVF